MKDRGYFLFLGKIQKGRYGYRTQYKVRMGIYIAIFLLAILIQYFFAKNTKTTQLKTIWTVTAILTVLPMANLATPYLATWQYRTAPTSQKNVVDTFAAHGIILYDLILTFRDMILPMDFCLVTEDKIFLYLSKKGMNREKVTEQIEKNLELHRLSHHVQVFDAFETFLSALQMCPVSKENDAARDVEKVLKSLSI